MKITYWTVNDYWKETGRELKKKGHDVQFNKIDDDTNVVLVIGAHAAFELQKYLKVKYNMDRFIYKGKIAMCVLDIPIWRFVTDYWFNYYYTYKKMLQASHEILTISEETSKQLYKLWDIESKPIMSIFNDDMVNKHKKKLSREHKIVCVGRFVEHKAFHQVIYALENTDYKLVIIGRGGPMEQHYIDSAKDLNINLEIKKDLTDEELVREYCTAEVVIHPSVFEGLSLVQKEALTCDTPVLHSDIPVHLEFHGDKVATFKANNIEDLKKAIEEKRWKKADKKHIQNLTIKKKTKELEKWLKSMQD